MKIVCLLERMLRNKVVSYMLTRYLVYFISFLSSLLIAGKLGPYYFGIWGFVLLLINYFHIIDFGIGNSMTVLLVQNKENPQRQRNYEMASMFILGWISLFVVCIAVYYGCFGISFFEKYHLGNLFYLVCGIAILQYFNDYFLKVYRVKGKMFEFAFYQTIIPVLVLLFLFFAREERLVWLLTFAYLIGHVLSMFFYLKGGGISYRGKCTFKDCGLILNKGFYLFVYNFCFYMIIVSTKTIIGIYYTVEEFGYFTFSYTLAHAALLLLTAFSSLITPKLIDKFHSNDYVQIHATVRLLRVNYVYLSHGLMYIAMIGFPILLYVLPKYAGALRTINLTALATILYANSFGYSSLLMAKNKEKVIARNSLISLILNVILAFVLIKIFHVGYEYVILATLVTYFLYAYLTVYSGKRMLQQSINFFSVMKECFPTGVLVPFLGAIVVTMINVDYLMGVPFLLFLIIDRKEVEEIYLSFKRILFNPNVIDI